MSLFGKKKEDVAPSCACNGNIKVLGSGCKSCHQLYENAQEAVKNMELSVEVEYVTDMQKIVGYGITSTPAMIVNDKVVSMGKVLKVDEVEGLFHKLGY